MAVKGALGMAQCNSADVADNMLSRSVSLQIWAPSMGAVPPNIVLSFLTGRNGNERKHVESGTQLTLGLGKLHFMREASCPFPNSLADCSLELGLSQVLPWMSLTSGWDSYHSTIPSDCHLGHFGV